MDTSKSLAEAVTTIPPGRRRGPGVVLGVLLLASAMAAVLGSGPLLDWAEQRESLEPLLPALTMWDEWMRALGPGKLHPAIRHWMQGLEQ